MRKTYIIRLIIAASLIFSMFACDNWSLEDDAGYIDSEYKTITEWLEARTDESGNNDMSLLIEALHTTDLYNRLGAWGSMTLFAPNNTAMEELYAANPSLKTDAEALYELIAYHIVSDDLSSTSFNYGGFLQDTTYQGLSLSVNLVAPNYIVNGRANIIELDNYVTNGFIHVIDEVVTIPNQSLYQALTSDYSLLKEGIDQYDDLVTLLSAVDIDSIQAATLITVSNDVFSAQGVTDIASLTEYAVDIYKQLGDTLTNEEAIERYVRYHVIPFGGLNSDGYIFVTDFINTAYPTNSPSFDYIQGSLSSGVDASIYLNKDIVLNDTLTIEGSLVDLNTSNFMFNNGLLHNITTPLFPVPYSAVKGEYPLYIQKEFEEGFYREFNEVTNAFDYGFYTNAGVSTDPKLTILPLWKSGTKTGAYFANENNIPSWVEFTINDIMPDENYSIEYSGKAWNYSHVFVYMYPAEEEAEFLANPYLYKLTDDSGYAIHAEAGSFNSKEGTYVKSKYIFNKVLTSSTYKIRFEIRGKNNFAPDNIKLTVI